MKLIVWDFDGTLVDSRPLIEAGMDFALDKLGLPRDVKREWLRYVGLPVETGIENTFGPLGLGTAEVLPAYRSFAHEANEHLLTPFPGMTGLLDDLRAAGIPMALATSKRSVPLLRQLARLGWDGRFDPLVTPDQVAAGKPDPESLILCLKHHGLAPEEAVMVGDTPFDMEMAQRAGVPRVAVGHGFYGQEALRPYDLLGYAPDTRALGEILKALR